MPTLLCVPILADDTAAALSDAIRAKDAGADLVEFRLDVIFDPDNEASPAQIESLVADAPLPCILTCRPTNEGGHSDASDADRIALFEKLAAAENPPSYIDIEHASFFQTDNLRDCPVPLITSSHDFESRPENLMSLLAEMREDTSPRVLKLAWRARSLRDNLEAFELLLEKDRPTIALAMGEFGLMSRVLAPKFGAFLTFASLRDESTTAPGQPTIHQLLHQYRFRFINKKTRVFGVVGYPVAQSMSPAVHNAAFEALEVNAVYLPLPVEPSYESYKATILTLLHDEHLDFAGASITIPHKEHAIRLAKEDDSLAWIIDPLAEAIGAANTLTRNADNTVTLTNTDAPALVEECQQLREDLSGANIAIVGAGGAARAAAFALANAGASIDIYNRTIERAQQIAQDITAALPNGHVAAHPIESLEQAECDICINCTPLGMTSGPAPEQCAVPEQTLDRWATTMSTGVGGVLDTVYNPPETPLVSACRHRSIPTRPGVGMFVKQAALQCAAWTDKSPPISLIDRVFRETITLSEP
jgi:3-dehydroquinate dehydratase/shikimate dehydrogenase